MKNRPARPDRGLDYAQNALRVVNEAMGQSPRSLPQESRSKNPAAQALSRLGASKGGAARAKALSATRKKAIAKKAALARWRKK